MRDATQLLADGHGLLNELLKTGGGLRRGLLDPLACQVQPDLQADEAVLRAVVQLALEPAALLRAPPRRSACAIPPVPARRVRAR